MHCPGRESKTWSSPGGGFQIGLFNEGLKNRRACIEYWFFSLIIITLAWSLIDEEKKKVIKIDTAFRCTSVKA
jgi:hypothetical protein